MWRGPPYAGTALAATVVAATARARMFETTPMLTERWNCQGVEVRSSNRATVNERWCNNEREKQLDDKAGLGSWQRYMNTLTNPSIASTKHPSTSRMLRLTNEDPSNLTAQVTTILHGSTACQFEVGRGAGEAQQSSDPCRFSVSKVV